MNKTQFDPDYCVHPREIFFDTIEHRGWNQFDIGFYLGMIMLHHPIEITIDSTKKLYDFLYNPNLEIAVDDKMAAMLSIICRTIKPYIFMNLWNTYIKAKSEGKKE